MHPRNAPLVVCACLALAGLGADNVLPAKWAAPKSISGLTGLKTSAGKQQGQTHTVEFKFEPADVQVKRCSGGHYVEIKGCRGVRASKDEPYVVPRKTLVVTLPANAEVQGVSVARGEYRELVGRFRPSRTARVAAERPEGLSDAAPDERSRATAGSSKGVTSPRTFRQARPMPDLLPERVAQYRTWRSREGRRVWVAVYPIRIDRRVEKMVLFNRLRVNIHYDLK